MRRRIARTAWALTLGLVTACGDEISSTDAGAGNGSSAGDGGGVAVGVPSVSDGGAFVTGNPGGRCSLPAEAAAVDVSHPTTVVGTGPPASCTADAVAAAIHGGGSVTFDCGPTPVSIPVPEITIFNDGGAQKDGSVTIDGGGKITLVGIGTGRILRQDTCDAALHWTTSHCNAQDTPHLVVQNIAFKGGRGAADGAHLGGGALYVGGGTFKAINVLFEDNVEKALGQDYAGGAIYTLNQTQPVFVVGSTFRGNAASNGGALGSIGTSWTVLNSLFDGNRATGRGANPARSGTTGGGLGGAIYNDGNGYTLTVCGGAFTSNVATELGSGTLFEVVDDLRGKLVIDQTTSSGDSKAGSVQAAHPTIYVEAEDKVGTAGVTITSSSFL